MKTDGLYFFTFGIAYLFLWIGIGMAEIGEPGCSAWEGEPAEWHFPVKVGFLLGFPFLLGILSCIRERGE